MHDPLTLARLNEGAFVVGFLNAALWAEHAAEDGTSFTDAGYGQANLSEAALKQLREDCQAFQLLAAAELRVAQQRGQSLESLGADFYFTRCGHGVGYWDRGLGLLGTQLTEKAKTYSSIDLYLGDDDQIHAQ